MGGGGGGGGVSMETPPFTMTLFKSAHSSLARAKLKRGTGYKAAWPQLTSWFYWLHFRIVCHLAKRLAALSDACQFQTQLKIHFDTLYTGVDSGVVA